MIKEVIKDHGGTLGPGDFTLEVTGTNVSNPNVTGSTAGETVTLDIGARSVGESNTGPYTPSFSPDCAGDIDSGESKTCTVTNDDNAPRPVPEPNSFVYLL